MTSEQIITWAVGIMATGLMGAVAHLYHLQGQMQEKMEQAMARQLDNIWNSIHALSTDLNADRKASSEGRVAIATTIGTLVTRQDLRDEIGRLIGEIDRRHPGVVR